VLRGYVAIVHEMEDTLYTCQCTLSNVPRSKGVSPVEIRCQMQVFMVIVLTCTLRITGPQNPSFGRKSHVYCFWATDGVIDMVVIEPGTNTNSKHCTATLKTLKQLRRVWKHKNILLQHDNARPHTLQTNTEAVDICHTDQTWQLVTSTFFQN